MTIDLSSLPAGAYINPDHEKILSVLLDAAEHDYAGDIALILLYGSTVNGTAHDRSDLDLMVIPKTERGRNLAKTFILGGVGYDIWNTPWTTLEAIARHEDMRTAILADSVPLYFGDENDRQKYELLKQNALSVPPLCAHDYRPVSEFIGRAKRYYGELCLTENPAFIGGIITELTYALCLLNRTYLRFGAKKLLEEVGQFSLLPPDFLKNARSVMLEPDSAQTVCGHLIRSTEKFVRAQFEDYLHVDALGRCVTGLYEEIASHWNKIRHACAQKDMDAAFLAASSLQGELDFAAEYLASAEHFDLFAGYTPDDPNTFCVHCDQIEEKFVSLLQKNGVPVTFYDNTDELKAFLRDIRDADNT